MEKQRGSGETERKLEGGEQAAKAQNQAAPKAKEGGLPAFVYIALWIALSSSVILFNKWILSTAKFRRSYLYHHPADKQWDESKCNTGTAANTSMQNSPCS